MDTKIDTLYSQRILQLAAEISHIGRLPAPQASAEAVSRLCGSQVRVELCMEGERVSQFAQEVAACALGQTSCAIMAEQIIGSTADELRAVATAMRALLHEGTPLPLAALGDKWADLNLLAPVRDYPNRHASTLLVFNATEDCLTQLGA